MVVDKDWRQRTRRRHQEEQQPHQNEINGLEGESQQQHNGNALIDKVSYIYEVRDKGST